MADKWPLANGNWSNAANWNGGTLPQPGDAVYADGKTVAIDQDVNVLSISSTQRSGGTGGGGFTATYSVGQTLNITANLYKGTNSHLLTLFGDFTLNITGNLYLAGSGSNTHIIYGNSFLGTMNIVGNLDCRGYGPNSVHGINQAGQAEIFLTGNIYAGDGGSASGIYANNGTNITVTGNVYAGTQTSNFAIYNLSTGFTVLNGNAYASSTAQAVVCSTGLLTVNGNAYGNTSFPAISTGGTLRMNGNSFSGSQGGSITFRALQIPDSGNFQLQAINYSNAYRSFYTGGQNLGQPTVNNVRAGSTFGVNNELIGTLVIPSAQYVSAGVPVDSGVGTLQHLTLNDLQAALAPNAPVGVERSVDDTKAISFSWPVSGASISGQKSVDYGAYSAVSGAISFLRTEGSRHYYSLAYSQYDRVSQEATIRYKMMDGTYTKYFNLRLVPPGITAQQIETQLNDDFSGVLTGISGIQSRLPATLVNGRMNATVGEMQTNVVTDTAVSAATVTKIQSGILTTSQFNVRSLPSGQYALESTAQSLVTLVDAVPTVAEFEARTIPSGQYALQSTSQSLVTLVGDVPTVAEFEARTLPSGEYFLAGTSVDIASVSSGAVQDIFSTYAIAEDYAASGMAGTPAQILYFMQQTFSQFAISGVTISVKKLDGTTNAATFIMDSEKNPKSRTRVS